MKKTSFCKTTFVFYAASFLIASLLVRLVFLYRQIQGDEAYSFVEYVSRPFYDLLSLYIPNNHVFYNIFAKVFYFIYPVFLSVRLPALIIGYLILIVNFLFISRVYKDRQVAFLATIFLASFPVMIHYSTLARGYGLLILFTLLIFYSLLALAQGGRVIWWFLFSIFGALGFYAMPVMLYPVAASCLWFFLIISNDKKKAAIAPMFLSLIGMLVLVCVLYMPIAARSGIGSIIANKYISPMSLLDILSNSWPFVDALWWQWHQFIPLPIIILLTVGFIAGVAFSWNRCRQGIFFIFALIASCAVLIVVLSRLPYLRCLIYLLPFYSAVCAYGVICLLRKARIFWSIRLSVRPYMLYFLLGVVINFFVLFSFAAEYGQLKSVPQIIADIRPMLKEGDLIVAGAPADDLLKYYFYQAGLPLSFFTADPSKAKRIFVVVRLGYGLFEDKNVPRVVPPLLNEMFKPSKIFLYSDGALYVFG